MAEGVELSSVFFSFSSKFGSDSMIDKFQIKVKSWNLLQEKKKETSQIPKQNSHQKFNRIIQSKFQITDNENWVSVDTHLVLFIPNLHFWSISILWHWIRPG